MSKTNVDLDPPKIALYSNTPSSAIAIDKFSIASLESISLEKLKRLPNLATLSAIAILWGALLPRKRTAKHYDVAVDWLSCR